MIPENKNLYQSPPTQTIPQQEPFKPKKRIFPKIFWTVVIIVCVLFSILFVKAYNFSSKVFVGNGSFFSNLGAFIFHPFGGTQLVGERQGQINILLMGYGGVGHDGPFLTDSMILVTIKPATKEVALISIPRDYYYPNSIGNKINNAFSYGFLHGANDPNVGGQKAEDAVGQLSGLTVPYFAAVDFSGFVKAVDDIGGLDVNVPNTFTDTTYPNDATNGYLPPLTFYAGQQHMTGERALEFARSRHAAGIEGSDFARSKRQQIILEAFKTKVQQLNLISDASKINDLINILSSHFSTNLTPTELLHLRDILNSGVTVTSRSLDEDSGLICQSTLDTGEFVLQACPGIASSQIQDFIQNNNNYQNLKNEGASIIIENAGNDQLYADIKQQLHAAGITYYEVQYKGIKLATSVLYEVNSKPLTEQYLENKLGIKHQQKPQELVAHADLVLYVGGSK